MTPRLHRLCVIYSRLCGKNLLVVNVLVVPDAVLRYDLDEDALEVDGEAALELVGAHAEDLEATLEVDVWVVVLV